MFDYLFLYWMFSVHFVIVSAQILAIMCRFFHVAALAFMSDVFLDEALTVVSWLPLLYYFALLWAYLIYV